MASKTYNQNGVEVRRINPQGRPSLPATTRRNCRVVGSVTPKRRNELDAFLALGAMNESAVLDMALDFFFERIREITVQLNN